MGGSVRPMPANENGHGPDPLGGFDGSVERIGERLVVIAPRGDLDAYSYTAFRAEVLAVQGGEVIVDLTEVTFVDSLAFGALLQAARRIQAQGNQLTIVCDNQHTLKVMEVTGIARTLPVERSLSDAIAHALAR